MCCYYVKIRKMELLEAIEKRRSVRDFNPAKKISKENIEKIIVYSYPYQLCGMAS
jgi:hypothetical protein